MLLSGICCVMQLEYYELIPTLADSKDVLEARNTVNDITALGMAIGEGKRDAVTLLLEACRCAHSCMPCAQPP